jgi:F-type H+-transporting ATPase subunit epsilon
MADELLQVELVAAEGKVWSGEASFVLARTTDGEIGILPQHAPVLSVLVESTVLIRGDGDETKIAAVDGGFLSVADNRVSILAEQALLADDIDAGEARSDLERAQGETDDDEDAARQARWAEARIAATDKAG